jgi:hypothetical protein
MRLMTGKRAETLLELMYQIEYFTLARAWEGLTSPEPVRTRKGRRPPRTPSPEPGTQDKPQSRRAAGHSRPESPHKLFVQEFKPETSHRDWPVDRG